MKNPVLPEHVEQFGAFMSQWQDRLNLRDWRVEPGGKPARRGLMATVTNSVADRLAVWRLGPDFGAVPVTAESLESTAKHECLHILLAELVELARCSTTSDDALAAAEHRVVITLEKLL